jgi:hypothetical protein
MKRQHIAITVTILAATGLVGGCSSDVAVPKDASESTAELSSEVTFPQGTYESTAELNDAGPMTVIFGDDGIQTIMQGSALVASGTYKVSGDQITLSDPWCRNNRGQETATYSWTWENSILAMTTTDDACADRKMTVQELNPVK